MRVYVYPADRFGCGHFRMIWPAEEAKRQGHDVEIVLGSSPYELQVKMVNGMVDDVIIPDDADVIVVQRPTFHLMPEAVRVITKKDVAVVVDVDDDLTCIHPTNNAFAMLHPRNQVHTGHSWRNVGVACRHATLVTLSADALASRYAAHGRCTVIPNCVPDFYLDVPHSDSDAIGWAGSIHSHPDDLQETNAALNAVTDRFTVVGNGVGVAQALRFDGELLTTGETTPQQWPATIATALGIGIAPLADTRFNESKSYLKPLEYAALGIPSVVSPRTEYARLARDLDGVVQLAQRPRDWVAVLRRLRDDAGRRAYLGELGRALVRERHTMSVNAWRWVEAWTNAYESVGNVRSSR